MADRATFTILSMMKDEGHSVLEWVAYHRHIGFDNICVYTNDCADGTDDILIRLEEMGEVRHFRNDVPRGRKPQPHALSLAGANPAVTRSDWILTMDADEFVSIKVGRGWVRHLVEAVPDGTDAIALTWRFFGSAGHTAWNPGLVTESFTRAAPDTFRKGWGVKTMFRPYADMKFGIHRPSVHKARRHPERAQALLAQTWVNGSGVPMPDDFSLSGWRSTKPTLGYGLAEMNHYAVKSTESFLLRGLRGNVNNKPDKYDANYFALFDRNEIEAPNALRHLAAVRRRMEVYLADPQIARLQRRAMAFHGARIARLRDAGEYDGRMAELRRASAVPYDRLDEVLFTQHLPREWQTRIARLRAEGVPERKLALMIARSRTATKSETRAILRASAERRQTPRPHPSDPVLSHSDRPPSKQLSPEPSLTDQPLLKQPLPDPEKVEQPQSRRPQSDQPQSVRSHSRRPQSVRSQSVRSHSGRPPSTRPPPERRDPETADPDIAAKDPPEPSHPPPAQPGTAHTGPQQPGSAPAHPDRAPQGPARSDKDGSGQPQRSRGGPVGPAPRKTDP